MEFYVIEIYIIIRGETSTFWLGGWKGKLPCRYVCPEKKMPAGDAFFRDNQKKTKTLTL